MLDLYLKKSGGLNLQSPILILESEINLLELVGFALAENCNTTVAFQIGQRCLACYSHCAGLTAFLPWWGKALNFLGLMHQYSISLIPSMTQTPLPLVISIACCPMKKRCSFCKAFQAKIGSSYSSTTLITLTYSLLLMTSQPPSQVRQPFKFTSYCIVFPVLLLVIFPAAQWSEPYYNVEYASPQTEKKLQQVFSATLRENQE